MLNLTAHPWAVLGVAAAVYIAACNLLRFRHERRMLKQFFGAVDVNDAEARSKRLLQMTTTEAQQIVCDLQQFEFPYIYRTALQIGIFKTYGVPEISRLLVATQALTDPSAAAKRYQDTVAMFAEFSINAPTSPRCLAAIARINFLHSRYVASGQIRNQDLLYTLSACVVEPIRFVERLEWRALNDMERCAMGIFWMSLGQSMQIDFGELKRQQWTSGLEFVDDITAWARSFESSGAALKPDPINIMPSRRLISMLLVLVPAPFVPFVNQMVAVLMGDRMREAFSLPEPGIAAYAVTYTSLIVRRFVMRFLMLPRFQPFRAIDKAPNPETGRLRMHLYLAHPWYMKPTWWNRWGPEALVVRLLGGHVPGDTRPPPETKTGARRDKLKEDEIGNRFMEDGFLIGDVGPINRMGQGLDEVAKEIERLRGARATGCKRPPSMHLQIALLCW
ncbi:dephospho- kinase [Ophiostoma piceae UAMH 11346]|uniref:Dephospho-kinase n=1 Tax=Ophiostoma piceae (strain UAMH 11346) TaxID=1262450 RepID=S3BNG4_OPHP1|nr:dephospho- kinase [Ophiostoma piceae UAMH 11346]